MEERKIQLRNGFADRNNLSFINKNIQLDFFEERTKVAIINRISDCLSYIVNYNDYNKIVSFYLNLRRDVFAEIISYEDIINTNIKANFHNYISVVIQESEYYDMLTITEYFCDYFNDFNFQKSFNAIFEKEFVGYRFVNGLITPITDEVEIEAIEEAIDKNPHDKCKRLIKEALQELSDREKPNYSLSIQRSITAVECICQIITNDQNATLGDALKKLETKDLKINGALKDAFSKMYGWTCNENDVRHANAFKDTVATFEDAKFMLVACSAFVNYLIGEYAKLTEGGTNG